MTISCTSGYGTAMKFSLEPASGTYLIRGYSESELRIGAERVTHSCLVSSEQLVTDWGPASFGELGSEHLPPLFALAPELVLIGTGPRQQFASAELRAEFLRRGVGLEVMQLGAACRTFNVLVQEGRRVVAALFLR